MIFNTSSFISFIGCEKDVDLGVVANYYQTVTSEEKEGELRNFIIELASEFDIAANKTHFAFIPFTTNPGDFDPFSLQWFNNSMVANMGSGDKAGKEEYLNEVLRPDNTGSRGKHLNLYFSVFSSSFAVYVALCSIKRICD